MNYGNTIGYDKKFLNQTHNKLTMANIKNQNAKLCKTTNSFASKINWNPDGFGR